MSDLHAAIVEVLRMDLAALSKRTGLPKPQIRPRVRSELALLFQVAVLGACSEGLAEKWTA